MVSSIVARAQTGATEPLRDWFPLSALGPFSDLTDTLLGERSDWGSLKCGCHPNCGIGTLLFVNKRTKEMVRGLGHTLPYLIPHIHTANTVAVVVVLIELGIISWVRHRYMDTPWMSAIFQVVVGGILVFLVGMLIGDS